MPLGLMPGIVYEETEAILEPGQVMLLHSDGVAEAHDADGEMFGSPRLLDVVGSRQAARSSTACSPSSTASRRDGWEQEDDITLVSLTRADGGSRVAGRFPRRLVHDPERAGQRARRERARRRSGRLTRARAGAARAAEDRRLGGGDERDRARQRSRTPSYRSRSAIRLDGGELLVRITDEGGEREIAEAETPDLEAKLEGLQKPRGWGLFLIENMVDDLRVDDRRIRPHRRARDAAGRRATMAATEFAANVRKEDGVAVLDLTGDVNGPPRSRRSSRRTRRPGEPRCWLDFSAVDYINSTGIALIVGLLAQARAAGQEVQACGLAEHYREIFRITRLSDFMTILDDEGDRRMTQDTAMEVRRARRRDRRDRDQRRHHRGFGGRADGCLRPADDGARPPSFSILPLEYMNSGGIGLLVTLLVRANRAKQRLLACGLNDHYRQIFELTRLDEAISIFDDEAAALAAVGAETMAEQPTSRDDGNWAHPVDRLAARTPRRRARHRVRQAGRVPDPRLREDVAEDVPRLARRARASPRRSSSRRGRPSSRRSGRRAASSSRRSPGSRRARSRCCRRRSAAE